MNNDRFAWDAGDIKFTLSQCHNCMFSAIQHCQKFGFKPEKYELNEVSCPEKVVKSDE
jgi:hypothetical protein